MSRKKNEKAQSILEYIIVLTAIVTIIILAAAQFIKPAVNKTMGDAGYAIENASARIGNVTF